MKKMVREHINEKKSDDLEVERQMQIIELIDKYEKEVKSLKEFENITWDLKNEDSKIKIKLIEKFLEDLKELL